jgi:hypothetical protein
VYCHTRIYDVVGLGRLELRCSRQDAWHSRLTADVTGQSPFGLALIDGANVDLCSIDNLTEGEARWMAHIVLDQRRNWFGRRA